MGTKGSLLCSQEPATCPFPEPDESSPQPRAISLRYTLIRQLCLGLPSGLFPSGFSTKALYALLSHMCYKFYLLQPPSFDHSNIL
jgi:hypothetical protein